MLTPFIAFWALLYLGREELQFKGVGIAVAIWLLLLSGFVTFGISPLWFVVPQALIDIGLVLIVFGRDIKIR